MGQPADLSLRSSAGQLWWVRNSDPANSVVLRETLNGLSPQHRSMLRKTPRVLVRAMVSETTRNEVWQELLDAARLLRYYETLSDRHRRKHRIIQVLLMAAATSGIATVLDLMPGFTQQIAGAAVAILVVWDFNGDYARKAAVLHAISIECNRLESRWHKLWLEIDRPDLDDADALHQCEILGQRLLDITSQAGPAGVEIDAELNRTCAEDAYKVMQERYAT